MRGDLNPGARLRRERPKRLAAFCRALLLAVLLPAPFVHAQSGILLKTFKIKPGKLLLDPGRPRLYATLPQDNGIAVINTDTNILIETIPTGQSPVAMAISPDGTRLYVANANTTAQAVTVVDLNALTILTNLPAPFNAAAVAAGAGNRLYVLSANAAPNSTAIGLAQIDATTGELQTTFGTDITQSPTGYLQISPDLTTLYCGSSGDTSTLTKFDVSTATPGGEQAFPFSAVGGGGNKLLLSHDGQFLVFSGSTDINNDENKTFLYSTATFGAYDGVFNIDAYPGPAAFSQDDSVFVEAQLNAGIAGASIFKLFDRATFTLTDWFLDPDPGTDSRNPARVLDLVITSPNGYLYYCKTDDESDSVLGPLRIVSTQVAPFFGGAAALENGYYYLKFADGVPFGYYNLDFKPYVYHLDLGFEYPFDALDGKTGIYLYDFTSNTFWYTSSSLFPYLYDFTLNTFLYYYPDPTRADHYNTDGVRYFYNFATGKIISK